MSNFSKVIDIKGLGVGLSTFNVMDLLEWPNNYALLCNPGFLELTESKCDSDCEIISFRRAVNNRYDDREYDSQTARLIIIDEYQDLISCVAKKLIRGIISVSYLCSATQRKRVVEITIPNKIISVIDGCRSFPSDSSTLRRDIAFIQENSYFSDDGRSQPISLTEGLLHSTGENRPLATNVSNESTLPVHMVRSVSRDGRTLLLPIYRKVVSICSNLEDHATIRYSS